jgi:hypothetical protein
MTDIELRLRCKECDRIQNVKISDVIETYSLSGTCESCGRHLFVVWYENYATIPQKPEAKP